MSSNRSKVFLAQAEALQALAVAREAVANYYAISSDLADKVGDMGHPGRDLAASEMLGSVFAGVQRGIKKEGAQ